MQKLLVFFLFLITTISAPVRAESDQKEGIKNKLSLEASFTKVTGNSETESYSGSFKLLSTYKSWKHTLDGKASNRKQDDEREEEYYKVSSKLDKKISDKQYAFGQLIYEDDRFAGINYRASELLGFGHKFRYEEDFKLSGEVGAGARQTDYTGDDEDEDTLLGNLGGDLFWKINENVEFNQSFDLNFGEENTETLSETSVKTFVSKNLYLRFSYEIRHNSSVPEDTKNTDIETLFTVGYKFG